MIDAWVELNDGNLKDPYEFGVNFADWLAALIRDDSPQGEKVRAAILDLVAAEMHAFAGAIMRKAPPKKWTQEENNRLQVIIDDLDDCIQDHERSQENERE